VKANLSSVLAFATFTALAAQGSVFEMRRVEQRGAAKTTSFKLQNAGRVDTVALSNEVLLDRSALSGARVTEERVAVTSGRNPELKAVPAIQLSFTGAGQKRFAELSKSLAGKQIGVVMDGRLVAAPILRDNVAGNSVTLTGAFTKNDAEALVAKVKSGK